MQVGFPAGVRNSLEVSSREGIASNVKLLRGTKLYVETKLARGNEALAWKPSSCVETRLLRGIDAVASSKIKVNCMRQSSMLLQHCPLRYGFRNHLATC